MKFINKKNPVQCLLSIETNASNIWIIRVIEILYSLATKTYAEVSEKVEWQSTHLYGLVSKWRKQEEPKIIDVRLFIIKIS